MGWFLRSRQRPAGPAWYREQGRIGPAVRWDRLIAARVRGRNGSYCVYGDPKALACNCDSRHAPCRHAQAVAAEWTAHPHRFGDLRTLVDGPAAAIERLILTQPGLLLVAFERDELPGLVASAGAEERRAG